MMTLNWSILAIFQIKHYKTYFIGNECDTQRVWEPFLKLLKRVLQGRRKISALFSHIPPFFALDVQDGYAEEWTVLL